MRLASILSTALLGLALPAAPGAAWAVWDITLTDMVATIDATVAVCTSINPAEARRGLAKFDALLDADQRQAVPMIRTAEKYRQVRDEEVDRLQSLTAEQRVRACEHAW